jgi:hypothetical protein
MSESMPRHSIPRPLASCLAVVAFATLVGFGCSSSSSNASVDGGVGFVTGALDNHCSVPAVVTQTVDPASCNPPAPDGGAPADDGGVVAPEFGDTIFNAEGDDDDCKYHIVASVTPSVTVGGALTFTAKVTKLAAPGGPATGAIDSAGDGVAIEGFMADTPTHVLPNTTPLTAETESPAGSGIYKITPVKFDASGRWVVRLHLYETCSDALDDSPHGHIAFYFDVP